MGALLRDLPARGRNDKLCGFGIVKRLMKLQSRAEEHPAVKRWHKMLDGE